MCLDSHWDDAEADGPVCWGTSPTGSKVSVTRCDGAMATQCGPSTSGATTVSATADERGRWEMMLPAGEAARVSNGECSWPDVQPYSTHSCVYNCVSVGGQWHSTCLYFSNGELVASHTALVCVCPMMLVSSILLPICIIRAHCVKCECAWPTCGACSCMVSSICFVRTTTRLMR